MKTLWLYIQSLFFFVFYKHELHEIHVHSRGVRGVRLCNISYVSFVDMLSRSEVIDPAQVTIDMHYYGIAIVHRRTCVASMTYLKP